MKRVRSPKSALVRLLDASDRPFYLLDHEQVIVFANTAVGRWQGVDPAELVGRRCEYRSDLAGLPPPVAAAHRLCPPPDLADGETSRLRLASVADESLVHTIQFFRCCNEQQELVGILAVGQAIDDDTGTDPRLDSKRLHEALSEQRQRLRIRDHCDIVLGTSPQARRLQHQVELASQCTAHVQIVGSMGSGRERYGRAIHALATSADTNPLIPLDCSLLDAELLQSTVAAFLQSCAELESPGVPVLLLLEVDRLEEPAQRELEQLLAIEELAVRAIATTQMRLGDLAKEKLFRSELAEQLSTLVIPVPQFVERREDLSVLCQALVEQRNASSDRSLAGFTAAAMELLIAYDWPHGYPELIAVVDLAVDAASGSLIEAKDLPAKIHQHANPDSVKRPTKMRRSLGEYLAAVEKYQLRKALRQTKGNKAKAARLLGIPRAKLLRRIEYFQLGE